MLDPDVFKDLENGRKPDVVAEGPEDWTGKDGKKHKRTIRLVVEVQTKPEKLEMRRREKFYLDTWPPKADRFVVVPMWKLKKKDSLSALRAFVAEYLP